MNRTISLPQFSAAVGLLVVSLTTHGVAQVAFDGKVNLGAGQEWGQAKVNVLQDNYTGYGDQRLTPGGFGGSELDELFVRTDGTFLYVGVTGNLEQNGNSIVLLFDTGSGGQNVLATEIAPRIDELPCAPNGPPAAVQGLGQALQRSDGGTPDDVTDDVTSRNPASTGTQLDAGFAPTYAIAVDTQGGQIYVSQYSLSSTALGTWDDPSTGFGGCAPSPNAASKEALPFYATRVYRGTGNVNSGNGTLTGGVNPGGSLFAFNNTGKQGITGESTTAPPAAGSGLPGDPRSQTTGLEAKIRLSDLGYSVPVASPFTIRMAVLLTSADGFVSNQTLPPIGAGTSIADLGRRPNFTAVAGNQYATVTRTTSAAVSAIDGTAVVSNFGLANLVASQNTVTSFGDRNCLAPTGGSELDELFLRTDGNYLYVAVSGNLETNGNAQILLLDVAPGGQNALQTEIAPIVADLPCSGNGPPAAVQGLGQSLVRNDNGTPEDPTDDTTSRDTLAGRTILDSGFEPDYAVAVDTSGNTLYVNQYYLSASVLGQWDDPTTGQPDCAVPNEALDYYATRIFRGQIGVGASSTGPASLTNGTNPNGSEFAFDNSGTAGVTGAAVAAAGSGSPGDPRSQTRGLEAKISLLDLGFAPQQLPVANLDVKAMVMLTSSDGYVSNQILPGAGLGTSVLSLGSRPSFAGVAGDQFVSASLVADGAFAPTINGRDLVNKYGAANIYASQDTVTGYGDVTLVPVTDCDQAYSAGSEIDRMVVQDTQDPFVPALEIGVTGNLEGNGNNLVIFLDTIAGAGETTLDGNAGRVSGMSGVTLPLQADYAVVANIWQGTAYVDLVNLGSNTSTYIGASGGGTFSGPGAVDWQFAFDNTNIVGVNANAADDPQTANAATATTGFEISIPLYVVGSPVNGDAICAFAIVTGSGNADWLSNQILPADRGGNRSNYDNTKPDLAALGYQCASMQLGPIGPVCNDPRFDADDDGDVDMVDFAAFQRCLTGPMFAGSIAEGCECFDWNLVEADGRINVEDFAAFQGCGTAAGEQADPDCDAAP